MPDITLDCYCCGWLLKFADGDCVLQCPACSTRNARPHVTDEALDKLRYAFLQRRGNDFDAAEESYYAVLRQHPDSHHALWGRLLCHYGVEYVENPGTRHIPTIHTVRTDPLRAQPEYAAALQAAPEDVRARYEQEAAYIDSIQAEIRKCTPPACDIFICDVPGASADGHTASGLYAALKKQGLQPFYAPESLTGVTGAAREARIFHAIRLARVMLIPCLGADSLAPACVHGAWSRFLRRIGAGESKQLIPLIFGDFDVASLPKIFGYYGAAPVPMDAPDAAEPLAAQLRSILGVPAPAAPRPQRTFSIQMPGSSAAASTQGLTTQPALAPLFATAPYANGCMITRYSGTDFTLRIPTYIDGQPVLAIGPRAFARAIHLQELQLPTGLLTIGEHAFEGCSSLRTLRLPWSVTTVDSHAFARCTSLTSVQLPNSLQVIGAHAFSTCTALQTINIPARVSIRSLNAFENCRQLPGATLEQIRQRAGLVARIGRRSTLP